MGWNVATDPDAESRTMAMLAHILALVAGILGPLVIWLIGRDRSRFVDAQGKEALNFQITVLIALGVAVALLLLSLASMFVFGMVLLMFAVAAIGVANLVFIVIAGVAAYQGTSYRYPVAIRFIR
jgi:uncharacterized protein